MTEPNSDCLQYFVTGTSEEEPRSSSDADGSREQPFTSLRQALEALGTDTSRTPSSDGNRGGPTVMLTCIARAGASPPPNGTPSHQYFVDPFTPARGKGTEQAPWDSFEVAYAKLTDLARSQQLALRVGDRLEICCREVFTATALEKWKNIKEAIAKYVFLTMALTCFLPVVVILTFLLVKAWPALSVDFLVTNPQNNLTAGGIWAPLIGTFFLVLTSLLVAAPIGILAGVYLNEYASDNWITRIINLAVMNLAGVPSIVHALFGVGAFVHFAYMGRSLLAAACTVAVMTLPVIITSTREALAAVPMSFREACWNMGATRWQTIRTIVLPNSIAGILTGVILQVARAAGETAPILFTGAVLYVPIADAGWEYMVPYGPNDRFMALSYHLFALSTQIRGISDELLYGTAVVLIGLVLLVNSFAIGLRIFLRSRKKW